MSKYSIKYGKGALEFEFPGENVLAVIKPNKIEISDLPQEGIIKNALEKPIASARLRDIVKAGETVCVIIPDLTRAWQSPHIYVPLVIEELSKGGVKDEDILIISATGTHRFQTDEEFKQLVSEDIFNRLKIIDHDSRDKNNLIYVGTTSRGTSVKLNKKALERDHIILAAGAVLHFLAGFGGGSKYILPGIAGYETIMKNHSLSLNIGLGSGINPDVKSGNTGESNPIYNDILEAASFVKPSFILNVVVDANKQITHAFAGNHVKAHEAACEIVDAVDGVFIDEKAEMVIASACGYPKDINFYQTFKTIDNAVQALKENGVMIIISECIENIGNDATEHLIKDFSNMLDREKALRENFSIGAAIGFFECDYAETFHFILVTQMPEEELATTNIKVVQSIDKALKLAYEIKGTKNLKTYMMPYGANTFPKLS